MKRSLALLALAGLALTGCSAAVTPAPAAAPSTSATPSPSAATASVADYIAGTTSIRRTTQEWLDNLDSMTCRAGSFQEDPLCSTTMFTAEMQATTAALVISGLNNSKNPDYVGAPPTELLLGVKQAGEIATKIEQNAAAINDDNCHETLGCGTHWWDVTLGMQELADELESWEAYK